MVRIRTANSVTEDSKFAIFGTGGHATVVIDLLKSAGFNILGSIGPEEPDFPPSFCDYLGGDEVLETLDPNTTSFAIGIGSIGDTSLRRRLFDMARTKGFPLPPIQHARAIVAGDVNLSDGVQVMAGSVVNPFVRIGENVIVNTGAIVEHHAQIGQDAHIAPGATICGEVKIGARSHIGAGSTVLHGVSVGEDAMVAAGSLVNSDVGDSKTVKGVPAH